MLEAQEVNVRLKLFGGAAFKAEADGAARSLDAIGAAGKKSSAGLAGGLNRSHSMLTKMGTKVSKVGSSMIGFGRTMTMAGLPIAAFGYYAVKASSQFGQAMTLLSTQANMPYKSIKKVGDQLEALAPKYGATPLALAQAMYPIESIGLKGENALKALKAAAMGSAVGLDSLENTSDAVTSIISSHIKGAGGPVEAMAIMDRAIGLGKMHLSDLTESFKSGIVPISQTFGLSFKQILAAASGLTRVGIPANQVMARMRLTLTSMISPTTAGQKAMAAMGLTQFQLADDLRKPGGLLTALADLNKHADTLGSKDLKNNAIAQIFGKSRGMASIASLLDQLPQITGIYGKVMGTTPTTLQTHFQQTSETSAFKYKQIQANYYASMVKLGGELNRVLLPVLVQLVPLLTSAVTWFGKLPSGVKKFLVVLLGAVVVGGPILMFTGALVKTVGAIMSAIAWIGRLGTASKVAAGENAAGGLLGFASGLKRAAGLLGLFAVALAVLPIMKNQAKKAARAVKDLGTPQGRRHIEQQGFKNAIGMNGGTGFTGPSILPPASQGDLLNNLFGWIPGLATGGTVMRAGLTLVGERGPELLNLPRGAVVKSSGPSNFGPDIASHLLSGMSSTSSGPETITNQLVLDRRVIAEVVNDVNRKNQNRR